MSNNDVISRMLEEHNISQIYKKFQWTHMVIARQNEFYSIYSIF